MENLMADTGARPQADTVRYETKNVQAIRGTEKLMIAKWEKDGWELLAQNPGKLRTELTFRRPKPKVQWKLFAIIGGVLAVCAIIVLIGVNLSRDDTTDPESTPATESSSAPRDEPSAAPDEPVATAPAEDAPLTIENNADLAALLTGPAEGPSVEAFAQKYAGRIVEFDGAVAMMNAHEGYTTRYDILIVSGDFSETHSNGGPSFQFRDVNLTNDLHLTDDSPETIGIGTNVHIIARIGSFKDPLFQLEPVQTRVR